DGVGLEPRASMGGAGIREKRRPAMGVLPKFEPSPKTKDQDFVTLFELRNSGMGSFPHACTMNRTGRNRTSRGLGSSRPASSRARVRSRRGDEPGANRVGSGWRVVKERAYRGAICSIVHGSTSVRIIARRIDGARRGVLAGGAA